MLNELKDTVSVTVGRGPQSMAFFAFIFSAVFTLFNTVFNDYDKSSWFARPWIRTIIKVSVFCVLFLFVMKNARFHNWLVGVVLRWLTTETYPPMT